MTESMMEPKIIDHCNNSDLKKHYKLIKVYVTVATGQSIKREIYIYIYINDLVEYTRDKDVNGLGTTCRQ